MFTKFIKIAQLLLLLNCIILGSCLALHMEVSEIDSEELHRVPRNFWPFNLFSKNAESESIINKENILEELKKYPLWKVQKYEGMMIKPVDDLESSNSTAKKSSTSKEDANEKDENISPADMMQDTWHFFRVRTDEEPYYFKFNTTSDDDTAETKLTTLPSVSDLTKPVKNETETSKDVGFFGYIISKFRGSEETNESEKNNETVLTTVASIPDNITVTTTTEASSGFFSWFGFGSTSKNEMVTTTATTAATTAATTTTATTTTTTTTTTADTTTTTHLKTMSPVTTKSSANVEPQSSVTSQPPANVTPQSSTSIVQPQSQVKSHLESQNTTKVTSNSRPHKMMRFKEETHDAQRDSTTQPLKNDQIYPVYSKLRYLNGEPIVDN